MSVAFKLLEINVGTCSQLVYCTQQGSCHQPTEKDTTSLKLQVHAVEQ